MDGQIECIADFFFCADTFEWLDGFWINQAIKGIEKGLVVEQVVTKNYFELSLSDERIKHDIDIEALCAVAAPFVFLGANVTATEN